MYAVLLLGERDVAMVEIAHLLVDPFCGVVVHVYFIDYLGTK